MSWSSFAPSWGIGLAQQVDHYQGLSPQALVAIVHPEFNASDWCHQETGWAYGRRLPLHAIRMGAVPAGFLSHQQWASCDGQTAKQVADSIMTWVCSLPELGDTVFEGLMNALASAGNYVSAGAAAERLAALGSLTPEQFARLDQVWWGNDQLYTGQLANSAMEPFYRANQRGWPPPKAATPALDVVDEPFF